MSDLSKTLIAYNRVTAPLIAFLAGILLVYLSFLIPDIIFAIPVETFLVFYWLKIFGIKKRILASLIVFLAVSIVASAIFADAVYSASGNAPTAQLRNGSFIQTSISPYLGASNDYNISYHITGNTSIGQYYMSLNSSTSAAVNMHVPMSSFTTITYPNGTVLLYTHIKNITEPGVYFYTLHFGKNYTYYVNNIGPVIASFSSLFAIEMLSYVPGYVILFELIFIVGIFIARSLSHSAQYSRRRQQPPQ